MAILNTIGTFYFPFAGRNSDYSPPKVVAIQTSGAFAGTTTVKILQSASTAKLGCGINKFHLISAVVSVADATATTAAVVYMGAANKIMEMKAAATGIMSANFGPLGIVGPEIATTNTVSLIMTGTATGSFIVSGYYEI